MNGVAKENNTYSHAINQYADFTLLSDHNPDNYRDIALSWCHANNLPTDSLAMANRQENCFSKHL